MAATMSAALVSATTHMAKACGSSDGGVIVAFVMAAEVVMFFPGMMVAKIRRIAPVAPGIRRISVSWITGIAVAISWTAIASAIEASAESACTNGQYDERLNRAS